MTAVPDARREALYERMWRETQARHARGETPPAFADIFTQFDATLIARADFPSPLLTGLFALQRELVRIAPHLAPMPGERLHLTLFPLYLDKPQSFCDRGTPEARAKDFSRLHEVWDRHKPIRVRFGGLNLTPQGVAIVEGFDIDGKVDAFRAAAVAALPDPERRPSESLHITLARPRNAPDVASQQRLIDWIAARREIPVGEVAIEQPLIRLTRDRQGAVDHEAGERELAAFYAGRQAGSAANS